MNLLNNTSNLHWVKNIMPYLKHRLFGFPQDGTEEIKFESFSIDGFPKLQALMMILISQGL